MWSFPFWGKKKEEPKKYKSLDDLIEEFDRKHKYEAFTEEVKFKLKTELHQYYTDIFGRGLGLPCIFCNEMMTDLDDLLIGILTDNDGYTLTVGVQHKFCRGSNE